MMDHANVDRLIDDRDRLRAEVATLEGMLADLANDSLAAAKALELAARVKVLEDALRPFAEMSGDVDGYWERLASDRLEDARRLSVGPRGMIASGHATVGDLRRAAKVMEGRADAPAS